MIHVPFRVVKGYFVVQKGAALMRTSSCIPKMVRSGKGNLTREITGSQLHRARSGGELQPDPQEWPESEYVALG